MPSVDEYTAWVMDGTVVSELTSMPSVGMSVTIWNNRQKVKKMYPSIAKYFLNSMAASAQMQVRGFDVAGGR